MSLAGKFEVFLFANCFVQVVVIRNAVVGSRNYSDACYSCNTFPPFWPSLKPLWISALYRLLLFLLDDVFWARLLTLNKIKRFFPLLSFILTSKVLFGEKRKCKKKTIFINFWTSSSVSLFIVFH